MGPWSVAVHTAYDLLFSSPRPFSTFAFFCVLAQMGPCLAELSVAALDPEVVPASAFWVCGYIQLLNCHFLSPRPFKNLAVVCVLCADGPLPC
jgi:hypothetical protein